MTKKVYKQKYFGMKEGLVFLREEVDTPMHTMGSCYYYKHPVIDNLNLRVNGKIPFKVSKKDTKIQKQPTEVFCEKGFS